MVQGWEKVERNTWEDWKHCVSGCRCSMIPTLSLSPKRWGGNIHSTLAVAIVIPTVNPPSTTVSLDCPLPSNLATAWSTPFDGDVVTLPPARDFY